MATVPVKNSESAIALGDLPKHAFVAAQRAGSVAWDIETSGLDWRSERIGLCQLFVPTGFLTVVRVKKNDVPKHLCLLLEDPSVKKIFHHAMFDLRFLAYHWNARIANVACTKVASKLLDPERQEEHTLVALLRRFLGVEVDKGARKSDWLASDLSDEQIAYAKNDVIHLPTLLSALEEQLHKKGTIDLAHKCFAHIPTQVELDIRGYNNIFGY